MGTTPEAEGFIAGLHALDRADSDGAEDSYQEFASNAQIAS